MSFAPLLNDRAASWDGNAARQALAKWASSDGSGDKDKIDWQKYARGFMWHASSPANLEDFKLPYCDVRDGDLVAIWKGVTTCAAVLVGSMGGAHIPEGDEAGCRSLCNHYYAEASKMFDDDSITPPWKQKNAMDDFEARFGSFGGVETRIVSIRVQPEENGDPNSPFSIQGHASVFERPSLDLGGFTEYIDSNAFDAALERNPDVILNWDHDNRWPLARTTSSSYKLYLNTDLVGLAYWGRVAPTSYAEDLRILMEAGLVNQASFAFTVARDEWRIIVDENGDEIVERTILEIGDLFDVCVTALGAYPQTDSSVARSYFMAEAEKRGARAASVEIPAELRVADEPETEEVEESAEELEGEEPKSDRVRLAKARARAKLYKINQ